MKELKINYLFTDENDFRKKLRSLKTYCPFAYKDFVFNVRKKIMLNHPDGVFKVEPKTTEDFKFIYGQIELVYSVKDNKIIMENIEPAQFLLDGYISSLGTYKGVCFRNKKDKFKIDLFQYLCRKECC